MKERGAFHPGVACLLFILVAIAMPARGQDTTTQDASTGADNNAGPPATEAEPVSPTPPLYYNQASPPSTFGEPGFGIVQRIPASEFGTPEYGVPYSSVPSGNWLDPFANHSFGTGFYDSAKLGGAEGEVSFGSAGISLPSLPFIRHANAPTDADLKIGPIYFDFDSLSASLLYTDNYNLSEANGKSETFAIIALNMTLIAQLSENLQFTVNGSLVYLPIQNILGFESSSLEGSLGFLLAALPALTANAVYDAEIAGWPVRFRDTFQTSTGSYSDNTLDSFNLFNGSVLQHESNGTYVFRSGHANLRNYGAVNNAGDQENYFAFFSNTLSATTTGYLPGDVDLTARADRSDLWYNNGTRGLPTSREDFYVLAQSVRPTMRFQPFASYEVSHSSNVPGVYQVFRAGLSGPITDQLFLYTDIGYFLSNTGNEGLLWTLDLTHVAGAYTTEDFQFRRGLDDFDDEVITTEYYRLNQILGPTLNGTVFADHSSFQELANDQTVNRDQEDVGVGLSWRLGPLTRLTAQGIYTHQNYDDDFLADSWTGRLTLTRTITDTLYLSFFYQYQNYHTNTPGNGYYENLVYITLTKYFH